MLNFSLRWPHKNDIKNTHTPLLLRNTFRYWVENNGISDKIVNIQGIFNGLPDNVINVQVYETKPKLRKYKKAYMSVTKLR